MERDYIRTRLDWRDSYSLSFGPLRNSTPHSSAPCYSDEYINYWSDVWLDHELGKRGILLETFLQYPHEILHGLEQLERHDHLPLLPEQRKVQQQLLVEELDNKVTSEIECLPGAECRNGVWIEPWHHNAYPRHKAR